MDEDDFGIFRLPDPFYFPAHPHHRWESEKFDMDMDDVFTTLPKKFNMMVIPILDRESFLLETQHVAHIAHNRDEFYELLQSQLEARRKELIKMMLRALLRLAGDPAQIDLPDRMPRHWGHAMHIARSKSFDAIVRFLAGFLRDEDPADAIAPLASGQDNPSSGSTAEESPKSNTAGSPRTRKRSRTPSATNDDDDEDEDEARPTKKTRFADDSVEPRASSSPRRPVSSRARRVRKEQPSPTPPPSQSTVPPAATAPSPSAGSRPSADKASRGDPTEGDGGQHAGSGSAHTDEKDGGRNNTRDMHDKGPAATGPEPGTQQGSCGARPRKGKPPAPSAAPRTKNSSKIQKKSTTSKPDRRATRTQAFRGREAVHQTRSSQRLTRQRGQGGSSFHELDSHGKARSVVA